MKKKKRTAKTQNALTLALVIVVIPFLMLWAAYTFPNQVRYTVSILNSAGEQLAAAILSHNFKSIAQIQSRYPSNPFTSSSKVRILLVPGHEPTYGGAEQGALKERDINVELAQTLQAFLEDDPHYQVFVTRDTGDWSSALADYFKNDWEAIIEWQKASRKEFSELVKVGAVVEKQSEVFHNKAAPNAALRLYGITKWANENGVDIAIHIHFNDNPGTRRGAANGHSGFAIYVPASQYGNAATTKTIAEDIEKRLERYNPVSDLPGESGGIIDEPELIAVGANNTSDAASMLIEYSYLYEPQISDPDLRAPMIRDMAFQTYLGLRDFFEPSNQSDTYGTAFLPHAWKAPITPRSRPSEAILALQTALMAEGYYPPDGYSKNDCPRTGSFGPCTRAALKLFQAKHEITGENDITGVKTLEALNKAYGR